MILNDLDDVDHKAIIYKIMCGKDVPTKEIFGMIMSLQAEFVKHITLLEMKLEQISCMVSQLAEKEFGVRMATEDDLDD